MLGGGLDSGTRWALVGTVNMFNEDNKLSIVLLVDMVTHSVWPKAAASINAVQPSLSTLYGLDEIRNICIFLYI